MIFEVLKIISIFLSGWICYQLSKEQKKNKWLGFIVGLIFGVFAITYYIECKINKKRRR